MPLSMQAMSGNIALVGTLAYVLSFAIGVGPVPGILVSEINAAAIRGEGLGAEQLHLQGPYTMTKPADLDLHCTVTTLTSTSPEGHTTRCWSTADCSTVQALRWRLQW